jgi:hypothetical protein
MDTLDEALTGEVVRSYGAALYATLLETASLHCRLPELYEDAAAYPPDEAVAALPVLVDLTKLLREQAAAIRELIDCLDHLQIGLRGGFDRPAPLDHHPGRRAGLARRRLEPLTQIPCVLTRLASRLSV